MARKLYDAAEQGERVDVGMATAANQSVRAARWRGLNVLATPAQIAGALARREEALARDLVKETTIIIDSWVLAEAAASLAVQDVVETALTEEQPVLAGV